jgi:4-amino-4-deoxychorismate lyase
VTGVWIDGVPGRSIEVEDRALQYGDGLFETIAVEAGRPRYLARHLARLRDGARRLAIPLPPEALLREEIEGAAAAAGVVKLILSRGSGPRGYRPPEATPRRIVWALPAVSYPGDWREAGVVLRLCSLRLAVQPALAGLKHLNRLEQVLARAEWPGPIPQEGLLLDSEGHLVGGTQSNVFLRLDGELATPRIERAGVKGVLRGALLDAFAHAGLACHERDLSLAELGRCDAILLTNALIGVWPVREFAGRRLDSAPLAALARECLARAPALD